MTTHWVRFKSPILVTTFHNGGKCLCFMLKTVKPCIGFNELRFLHILVVSRWGFYTQNRVIIILHKLYGSVKTRIQTLRLLLKKLLNHMKKSATEKIS